MKPSELAEYLETLVTQKIDVSTMIWGPPGIGKSSIVKQVASDHSLEVIDLRLSQLAPTDLRGLPVPKDNQSVWLPPEFLPNDGAGVIFMDEINMAPPAMQGVAQQLILDRKVGSYRVPDGWFIWSAGNRKEDRAAVFDMPQPLANRFIHLDLEPSVEDFRQYAHRNTLHPELIAFLSFRQDLLHKIIDGENAWPSPRSWEMANTLHQADLDMAPAVGVGPASEFYAYCEIVANTPDLKKIAKGSARIAFPQEPSLRYATVIGLVALCGNTETTLNCFHWLVKKAPAEWVQLFASDLFPLLRARNQLVPVHQALTQDPDLNRFLTEFSNLLAS